MTTGWIRARLRGVYSADAAAHDARERRLSIELDYGTLSEVAPIEPGPPPDDGAKDWMRFARIDRLRVAVDPEAAPDEGDAAGDGGGLEGRELTLYDVRLRDWKLLYPARSGRRVFGTLVGELWGRLDDPSRTDGPLALVPTEGAEPLDLQEDAVDGGIEGVEAEEPEAAAAPPAGPPLRPLVAPGPPAWDIGPIGPGPRTGRFDFSSPEIDLSRFLALVVAGGLCAGGIAVSLACGPQGAALWVLPIVGALALRWFPEELQIEGTGPAVAVGGVLLGFQVFWILAPLQVAWETGCSPSLGWTVLPWIGFPVLVVALVRRRTWVFASAAVWTWAFLAGGCGAAGADCAPRAASGASVRTAPIAAPVSRTDEAGRWPASPRDALARGEPVQPMAAPPARIERVSLDQVLRGSADLGGRPVERRAYVPSEALFEEGADGGAAFSPEAEAELRRIAAAIRGLAGATVVIEVHTARATSAEDALASSDAQGEVLARWLGAQGDLDPARFEVRSMGDREPIVPRTSSSSERAPNRRLELYPVAAPER